MADDRVEALRQLLALKRGSAADRERARAQENRARNAAKEKNYGADAREKVPSPSGHVLGGDPIVSDGAILDLIAGMPSIRSITNYGQVDNQGGAAYNKNTAQTALEQASQKLQQLQNATRSGELDNAMKSLQLTQARAARSGSGSLGGASRGGFGGVLKPERDDRMDYRDDLNFQSELRLREQEARLGMLRRLIDNLPKRRTTDTEQLVNVAGAYIPKTTRQREDIDYTSLIASFL